MNQTIFELVQITSRVFNINENQLNITEKITWTTARNKLHEFALNEEQEQGSRRSYYNFADGDIHTMCPLAEQLLANRTIVDYGKNEEYIYFLPIAIHLLI